MAADERFIRWQRYTIEQLTFVLNLFLGLSGASLAFGIALLREESFLLTGYSRCAFSVGLVALAVSVLVGCAAVVSRLLDFRYTAATTKKNRSQNSEDEAGVYRYKTKILGVLTWRLFWLEVLSFFIGVVGLIIGLVSKYGHKLW